MRVLLSQDVISIVFSFLPRQNQTSFLSTMQHLSEHRPLSHLLNRTGYERIWDRIKKRYGPALHIHTRRTVERSIPNHVQPFLKKIRPHMNFENDDRLLGLYRWVSELFDREWDENCVSDLIRTIQQQEVGWMGRENLFSVYCRLIAMEVEWFGGGGRKEMLFDMEKQTWLLPDEEVTFTFRH